MTKITPDHENRKPRPKHRRPLPDFSWLEVYAETPNDHLLFRARFGDGDLKVSGGGAGWQSVQRPKKRALVTHRGPTDAFQYDIPIVIDGFAENRSVEQDVRTLEIMAGVNVAGDPKPPLLILNAQGTLRHDVYHAPQNRWVIPTEPVWGETIRRASDGHAVRQLVTVSFMLYTADDELSRAKQVSTVKYTTARQGDTYSKIAARALKAWGGVRWGNRLAQLNGARDGASKPQLGQLVKLPSVAQIEQWKRTPRR